MEHTHLDAAALERMLDLDRTADQNRNLLHQIAVCPECRKVGGYLLDLHQAGALPPVFSSVDVAIARSRAEAPRLWDRLSSFSPEQRSGLVRASRSFASWGLCELLCEKSKNKASQVPDEALELAELAILIADSLEEGEPIEERWVYQLRALAWAYLGNARRVGGDLISAEQAFSMSDQWWEAGESSIGDALGYGPVLLDLRASLRTSQRRFREALGLLDEVAEAYLHGDPEFRDPHLAGRSLVNKAVTLIQMGEPRSAVASLRAAEALISQERDPRLGLCLKHNLASALVSLGKFQEALAVIPEVRALSQESGSPLDQIRLRWIEARAAAGVGDREAARQGLDDVRREFLERRLLFDAALASLELAALHLEEGRTGEVQQLAEEMVVIFHAQDVHREALAAIAMFRQAVALETVTAEMVRRMAFDLERVRRGIDP
jgi:tetratricopeptide (TPR) repeat protein